jgi:hypothetical protein
MGFGVIHGNIGVLYQRGGIISVLGVQSNPYAGTDMDLLILYIYRRGKRSQYSIRNHGSHFLRPYIGEHQNEFVAPESRNQFRTMLDIRSAYRKYKSPIDHSPTDHVPVTKRAALFKHAKTLRYSALTTQAVALARTTCAATPGIRPTGGLAALWVTAIAMR